jgi:two-component system, chemotaxis family, chemotaxis protein CheY
MRILIVEDSSPMRGIIKNILKQIKLRDIDEAVDGDVAWEKIQKNRYSLIICDWFMPKMNGIDLLKLVRNSESTKDTPFIMIAAVNSQENALEAINEKVSGFIIKPFTAKTLQDNIGCIFKKKNKSDCQG